MISPTDLLRAAAQSARAAAAVEIAKNIGGSEDADTAAPAPETDPQVVPSALIADQVPQSVAAGPTLAGLSQPSGGLLPASFQPGESRLQSSIAGLARQLATQFLQPQIQPQVSQPGPQAVAVPGQAAATPAQKAAAQSAGQLQSPQAQQPSSAAPGQAAGPPIQTAPANPLAVSSLAGAVQAFLSQSMAVTTPSTRPVVVTTATTEPARASEAEAVAQDGRPIPRVGQDLVLPATVNALSSSRNTSDSQSATSSSPPKSGEPGPDRRTQGNEAVVARAADQSSNVKAADAAAATASLAGAVAAEVARNAAGLPATDDLRLAATFLAQALTGQGAEGAGGGIISSFILNAAMIPGWTLPRLPDSIEEQFADLATRMLETPEISQTDLLAYLANFGGNEQLLERLRKAQMPPSLSIKVLGFLSVLMTAITTILSTLREETAELLEELTDQERDDADLEPDGKRKRLYLR